MESTGGIERPGYWIHSCWVRTLYGLGRCWREISRSYARTSTAYASLRLINRYVKSNSINIPPCMSKFQNNKHRVMTDHTPHLPAILRISLDGMWPFDQGTPRVDLVCPPPIVVFAHHSLKDSHLSVFCHPCLC